MRLLFKLAKDATPDDVRRAVKIIRSTKGDRINLLCSNTMSALSPLPRAVEGVSVPNDDGSFDIYINSRLSRSSVRRRLSMSCAI